MQPPPKSNLSKIISDYFPEHISHGPCMDLAVSMRASSAKVE